MNENVKTGWKTTEFWMTIGTTIFGVLVMASVLTQDEAAEWMAILAPALMVIVPQLVYTVSRAKVKAGK